MSVITRFQTWTDKLMGRPSMSHEERLELRRNRVRVYVTYAAAGYIFLGTPAVIYLVRAGKLGTDSMNLFMMVLPIASGIVSFWFGARGENKKQDPGGDSPKQ